MGPEYVTPVVTFLASEACEVSGHIYSVAGGRVARVFYAESPGVVLPNLSAEAVRDNLAMIDEPGGFYVPDSLDEETSIIAKALAS